MANNYNDPNRSDQPGHAHTDHGARRVDVGPEHKSKSWLWLLAIPLIALLAWALWPKHRDEVVTNTTDYSVTNTTTASDYDGMATGNSVDVATATPGTPAPNPAVPSGSGVVNETRDGKPALLVYFETGKSDVSKDMSAAVADVKSYLAAHSGSTVAVSGFNDPTGNAAANAALSKRRAQEVSKALAEAGVPASSIKLEKPAETTATGDNNAQSRRVEVTVKN